MIESASCLLFGVGGGRLDTTHYVMPKGEEEKPEPFVSMSASGDVTLHNMCIHSMELICPYILNQIKHNLMSLFFYSACKYNYMSET